MVHRSNPTMMVMKRALWSSRGPAAVKGHPASAQLGLAPSLSHSSNARAGVARPATACGARQLFDRGRCRPARRSSSSIDMPASGGIVAARHRPASGARVVLVPPEPLPVQRQTKGHVKSSSPSSKTSLRPSHSGIRPQVVMKARRADGPPAPTWLRQRQRPSLAPQTVPPSNQLFNLPSSHRLQQREI
ncbi:hypothetical protein BDV96DRAFT_664044 [Lophiotrema nucula]|uniref:Uncharacterized protein n=1 Tax=Lophiotrema nucula TaxID=690887 RepID=A0A6A5Z2P6_9PLEO|nr:hypothetical protein BDV96DRAFT_664044 [Lophiotrema nucula]